MKSHLTAFRRFMLVCCTLLTCSTLHAEEAGQLKVGATATGSPFTYLDIKSNSIQGMMVDTVQAVAKAGGFAVQIEPSNFAALIPSLTSGKIDLISAGMLKTSERAKIVDFSVPVYSYGEGVVVAADDNGSYPDLQALKGEVIGAQAGTAFYDMLNKLGIFKEIRTYDSIAEMVRDLNLGRIKAGVADAPILAYQIQQKAFKNIKLAAGYKASQTGDVCLVVRKGDTATLDRLNQAIEKIKADGTLQGIVSKWGV